MIKLPFSILLSGFLLINPAFAQDQDQQQPAAQDEAVTGMGTRLTAGPTFGGWTNPNSTGLSSSSCNPGEYAVGVQVDGARRLRRTVAGDLPTFALRTCPFHTTWGAAKNPRGGIVAAPPLFVARRLGPDEFPFWCSTSLEDDIDQRRGQTKSVEIPAP